MIVTRRYLARRMHGDQFADIAASCLMSTSMNERGRQLSCNVQVTESVQHR